MDSDSTPSTSPETKPKSRWRRRIGLTLVGALVLVVLLYGEENWRGKMAWEEYRRQAEARGQPLDWVLPEAIRIPDEQNFARTPLLQAIGIYGRVNTNVMARFDQVHLLNFIVHQGSASQGRLSDWKACQDFLRARTNYSLPPLPQEPAADVLTALRPLSPK